ncbi:hypothetical protein CEXT_140951 [Caerostris extrusa]|uniref:Uncharacterized protein n=1 Tax=Caerostris extrusa TaxID=172846 RepID=A0AAV4QHU8_CAEEX|nr:hypothetical protein CEXT_140951 [Caerostris extrusa]
MHHPITYSPSPDRTDAQISLPHPTSTEGENLSAPPPLSSSKGYSTIPPSSLPSSHTLIILTSRKAITPQTISIQSLDSLNQDIVQVFLSSQSDGNLSEDPVIAARWSHQCHYSMVLMRRLLIDAQGKFRKMVSDNRALASRIDQDIQSAHLQMSALRAELADTNQRITDICEPMAGNVITTCMPPTSTTNSAAVISTAEGHWLKDANQGSTETAVKVSRVCSSSPPIADKGGTRSSADFVDRPVLSPKSIVPQGQKVGEQKTNLVNGSSPDQSLKKDKVSDTHAKDLNDLDKVSGDDASLGGRHFLQDGSERPQIPPKQTVLASKGLRDPPGKDTKEKPEGLTESSKVNEELSVSKHKGHRRERRSLRGSDVQKSVLEDLKSQSKLDDSKSELQRSESDGNQNSAPECDLSISGSPFKEDSSKVASEDSVLCSSSSLKSSPRKTESSGEGSKKDDFSMDYHRSSPPVKDESNAQCFPLLKDAPQVFLQKDSSTNGHRYKAKTKSDPLDKRRDNSAQEFSILSSPSSVMRHKTGVSKLQLGICNWDSRKFEHKESWYKTQDASSSMSGKSMDESSSKEETSDSQDGLPPEYCDQRPIRDENKGGRFVIFDSKNIRGSYSDWRTSLSESYRDQQVSSESWKSTAMCSAADQMDGKTAVDDKRQVPEKDQNTIGLIQQDSSYYRKTENLEYSSYNSAAKSSEECEVESLRIKNSALLRDLEEVMESRDEKAKENAAMHAKLDHMDKDLKHAKEALSGELTPSFGIHLCVCRSS